MKREEFLREATTGKFNLGITNLPIGSWTARFTDNDEVMVRKINLADDNTMTLATMEMEVNIGEAEPKVAQISCNDAMLAYYRRTNWKTPTYRLRVEERTASASGNKYNLPIFEGIADRHDAEEKAPIEDTKPAEVEDVKKVEEEKKTKK